MAGYRVNFTFYPLHRRLNGLQSRYGRFGEMYMILLSGIEPWFLRRPARSVVTMQTELPRLPECHIVLIIYFNENFACTERLNVKAPFEVYLNDRLPTITSSVSPMLYLSHDNGRVPFTAAADSGLGYVMTWSV